MTDSKSSKKKKLVKASALKSIKVSHLEISLNDIGIEAYQECLSFCRHIATMFAPDGYDHYLIKTEDIQNCAITIPEVLETVIGKHGSCVDKNYRPYLFIKLGS